MTKTQTLLNSILFVLLFQIARSQETRRNSNFVVSNNYRLKKINLNSDADDVGVFIANDTLYFSSNRKTRRVIQTMSFENKKYFFNIYNGPLDSISSIYQKDSSVLKGEITTTLNESFPFITKDGKTMFYTANAAYKKK